MNDENLSDTTQSEAVQKYCYSEGWDHRACFLGIPTSVIRKKE